MSDTESLFGTEKEEHASRMSAIAELEAKILELEASTSVFHRKVKVGVMAQKLKLPWRLVGPLETVLYGEKDERLVAGRLLSSWARGER